MVRAVLKSTKMLNGFRHECIFQSKLLAKGNWIKWKELGGTYGLLLRGWQFEVRRGTNAILID